MTDLKQIQILIFITDLDLEQCTSNPYLLHYHPYQEDSNHYLEETISTIQNRIHSIHARARARTQPEPQISTPIFPCLSAVVTVRDSGISRPKLSSTCAALVALVAG